MDNFWQSVLASTGVASILIGGAGAVMCFIGVFYSLRARPHKTDDVDWVNLFTTDPHVWSVCFLYLYAPKGQVLVQQGWKWLLRGLILIVAALLIQVLFALALIV